LTMERAGFYPRGGGIIHATIHSTALRGFNPQEPTPVTRVHVRSAVAGLPEHISKRQARRAVDRLADRGVEIEVHEEQWPGGPGTMLGIELNTQPAPTFF